MDASIQPILWALESACSYVNHATTFELVDLPGTTTLAERIEAAYPEHAPCRLVAVAWEPALRDAVRRIAIDDSPHAAPRVTMPVIERLFLALDAWLGAYHVTCFEVHHPVGAHGNGLFGYLSDATHALVLQRRDVDRAPPEMYLFGLGWSD